MANYTGPDPNNLLPGEPWTSQLALASFEDPVAIAEGADGAPIVQSSWHPWNATVYGAANAPLYDFAVDGALATIETPVFAAGYEYRLVVMDLGGGDILVNVRRQSTAAYQTAQVLFAGTDTLIASGYITFEIPMVSHRAHRVAGGDTPITFGFTAADRVDRARLTRPAVSTFARGRVYLERRRVEGL